MNLMIRKCLVQHHHCHRRGRRKPLGLLDHQQRKSSVQPGNLEHISQIGEKTLTRIAHWVNFKKNERIVVLYCICIVRCCSICYILNSRFLFVKTVANASDPLVQVALARKIPALWLSPTCTSHNCAGDFLHSDFDPPEVVLKCRKFPAKSQHIQVGQSCVQKLLRFCRKFPAHCDKGCHIV
jgi:hypothetical protein